MTLHTVINSVAAVLSVELRFLLPPLSGGRRSSSSSRGKGQGQGKNRTSKSPSRSLAATGTSCGPPGTGPGRWRGFTPGVKQGKREREEGGGGGFTRSPGWGPIIGAARGAPSEAAGSGSRTDSSLFPGPPGMHSTKHGWWLTTSLLVIPNSLIFIYLFVFCLLIY